MIKVVKRRRGGVGGVELQVDLAVDGGLGLRVLGAVLTHLREGHGRHAGGEGEAAVQCWASGWVLRAVRGHCEEVSEGWI